MDQPNSLSFGRRIARRAATQTLAATLLATLAVPTLGQTAKAQDAQARPTVMSASEIKGLNKKVQAWMDASLKHNNATSPRARTKASKKKRQARDKFTKDWKSRAKKHGDLLKSVPDLEGVFRDAFPYPSTKAMKGQVAAVNTKGTSLKYDAFIPKGYKPAVGHRVVIQLTGLDESGDEFVKPRDHFAKTWQGSPLQDDTIFILPPLDAALDLDASPDFAEPGEEAKDMERRKALFQVAGFAQRSLNFDRSRMILDCGKGSCRFGMRMATYFPTRFAGLILRYPEEAGIRYESLCGMPVLLVKKAGADNAQFIDDLAKQLNELSAGSCKVVEASDDYPFAAAQGEISKWTKEVQRDLFRSKVVIAPNHDLYHKAYWIELGTVEPLDSVAKEDRPYLEAVVNKEENKIDIKTKSVSSFVMLLNDDIVDLDKEVTVVVNGVPEKQKRSRQFSLLQKLIWSRFDPNQLFTVEWRMSVPAEKE